MSPSKRRVSVDATFFCSFANRKTVQHTINVLNPYLKVFTCSRNDRISCNDKRFSAILLALLLTLCLVPTTLADVIFEPRSKFFESHREDMVYVDKVYIANELVYGYESPEDDDMLLSASDGTRLYISHAYTDANGEKWGVYDWDTVVCWFRLSELEPVYDTRDFIRDHDDEFTDYADELADLPLDGGEMPLWQYPGSGSKSGSVYLDEYFEHDTYALYVYLDAEGRAWVYFPYVFGMEGWANAADPLSTEPIVFDANAPAVTPEPTATPAPTDVAVSAEPSAEPEIERTEEVTATAGVSRTLSTTLSTTLILVLGLLLVGFVMVVAVVLILVFFVLKKKK